MEGLTIAAVSEIRRNYSQDIIIPMTLVHPDYLTEILDGLRQIDDQLLHIFLMLNEDLLRHRISNQTMHPDPNRNAEIRVAISECRPMLGQGTASVHNPCSR